MKNSKLTKIIAIAICSISISLLFNGIEAKASTMSEVDILYKTAYDSTVKARDVKTQVEINKARKEIAKFRAALRNPNNSPMSSTLSVILDQAQQPSLSKIVTSIIEMSGRTGKVHQDEINAVRILIEGDESITEDDLPKGYVNHAKTWNSSLDKSQGKLISAAVSLVVKAESSKLAIDIENAKVEIRSELSNSSRKSMRTFGENLNVRLNNIEKNDGKIKAGMYKVGTDIPAGEYIIFAESNGYVEISKDSSGTFESIIGNEIINGNFIVTVNDGEYLKVQSGDIYPFDKAPKLEAKDGVYSAGMYKVGVHIPAGEYKVIPKGGMAYIEVRGSSSLGLESIISNNILSEESYITIKDGQYIKIQRAELKK